MKKRDIIIVTLCVVTAAVCIALTFCGNYKNNGVLTTDAFIGVLATLIGVCATIIVGFQIASFVKIQETERLTAKAIEESKKLETEKNIINRDITSLKVLLSNTLMVVSINANDRIGKVLAEMMSICCVCLKEESDIILQRYQSIKRNLLEATPEEILVIAEHKHNLKNIYIPSDIEHYTEIMKLHIEILDILENTNRH
ncbi:MAG: hypothetical protein IKL63_06395 [Alistipes sp.]|nr:hypothetical protein [Alistipes sp.]